MPVYNTRKKRHRNEVNLPTYTRDIVGEIGQVDERDIVFARSDLYYTYGEGSPEFKAYYKQHPEWHENDIVTNAMPGLGRTAGDDIAMMDAQFDCIQRLDRFETGVHEEVGAQNPIHPERAALKIKSLARILGANLVRIGPLRQEWVYSHIGRTRGGRRGEPVDLRHHQTAIVMGFQMDYELIQHAPDFPVLLATAQGYAKGAWTAVQLADYLRNLGYSARAHYDGNYWVQCVPVAVDAGMGELSRAGFLLTKEFGLALRLAVVTTDMQVRLDSPVDIAVQSFCESCKICAEICPIKAIPEGDKVTVNGTRRWKLDAEKCYRYWHAVGSDCALCMVACPWSKPSTWFHQRMADLAAMKGLHQKWMAKAEKVIYGRFRSQPRPSYLDDDPQWHHILLK
jgi:ferredoxin